MAELFNSSDLMLHDLNHSGFHLSSSLVES